MTFASFCSLPRVFDLADMVIAFWFGGIVAIAYTRARERSSNPAAFLLFVGMAFLLAVVVTLLSKWAGAMP